MRGGQWKKYVLFLSLLALVLFVIGSWEKGVEGVNHRQEETMPSFFHGKKEVPGIAGSGCLNSTGCHVPFPHKENRRLSAFVNMHGKFLDCLVCHGVSGTTLHLESARGRKIIHAVEITSGSDPHGAIEKPLSCRDCHSPAGAKGLEERTKTKFKADFTDPFALQLIEEDMKKWEVPGM